MYNRDEEFKLFPQSFGKHCECRMLAAGKEVVVGSE